MRFLPLIALGIGSFAAPALSQQLHLDLSGSSGLSDFGTAVANLGDLNGDGAPEIAVGAPDEDFNGADSGSVFVLSSTDGAQLFRFDGSRAGARFGISVAGTGDVDGDGTPDVLAGAKRIDDSGFPSGYAEAYSGATGALLYRFETAVLWDRFGHAVAGPGDVNADGFADLLVTAPEDDWQGPGSGSARIYSGADGSILHTLYGDDPWDRFGWCATGAGDVDGDGRDDVAIGSPLADRPAAEGGAATVFSGRTGAVLAEFAGAFHDSLGTSISGGHDMDGDGLPEIVVGAVDTVSSLTLRPGYVDVFSTATGFRLYRIGQDSNTEAFGSAVAANGDLNGDSFADIVVGVPFAGNVLTTGFASGQARAFVGINGRFLYEVEGSSTLDKLGSSVAVLDDTNQDSFGDFLVGVPGGNPNGNARIYQSNPSPLLSLSNFVAGQTATLSISGAPPNSSVTFYYSLDGLGRTNIGIVDVDLAAPVNTLATVTTDGSGNASTSFPVSGSAQGVVVAVQGVIGAILSAALQEEIQ